MSLGDALEQRRPGPAFDVSVYLRPDRSSELNEVAREVREMEGIKVVAVLDQQAIYDEFLTLFADHEDLIASVIPSVLPAAVRATVVSEDQIASLEAALGEDRIHEIVYEHGLKADAVRVLADRFDDEFDELERTTNDELQHSFAVIRSDGRPPPAKLRSALAEVAAFRERECGASRD